MARTEKFWAAAYLIGGIAVFLILEWLLRPRCERHGEKVAVGKVPGLGCWRCIREDMKAYIDQQRKETNT